VYKAVYPLDRMFLEHHDVQINLASRKAVVRNGRIVEIRLSVSAHFVAWLSFPARGECVFARSFW
jgi:4'-phosphopantetheinyl transferase EntD